MAGYPVQYESDVVARDGSTLRLRPVRADDAEGLRALHGRLSEESLYFRFLGARAGSEAEVARLLRADHETEFVLVAEARAAERSHAAATASMKSFFEPRGVVLIGASRRRGKIGSEILHNLAAGGFTGRLYAVHPSAAYIDGVRAYPRVTAIPEPVDLAVVSVPCDQVSGVVDDCIAKGVRALVVISAGFGETGAAGRALEQEILQKVRTAGIRLIGPNCMGIINTAPAVRLNATFSPVTPVEGRVAFSTQSSALGLAILDYVRQLNLGISTFVSVGNKADVSGNDLIQYWADGPRTDVILLYLESFGNPRRFARIARRVAEKKPIVAVKSGRSRAGARAASSHTGALAASDAVVDALFRQAGVIRTATLEELFDVATLVAHQALPAGRRVAVLSNAGGPAILAADACEAHELELAPLGHATAAALREFLPAAASVANPVDMLASATPAQYERATRLLLADESVDSLLVIFIPPLVTRPDEVARALAAGAAGAAKPVLANFISSRGAPPELAPIPSYLFPEAAVAAAGQIGYPVVLKAAGPEIVHKTEIGGVILDVRDEPSLGRAWRTLRERAGDAMTGALVQQMVPGGVELIVGAVLDPTFGPLVACGSGGVLVELLGDTVFRLHPLTDLDATEMVESLKSAPLLHGYRGHAPADARALVDALLRVSVLVELCPEIQELDINPLKVLERGVAALDVRVRISRPDAPPPTRRIAY